MVREGTRPAVGADGSAPPGAPPPDDRRGGTIAAIRQRGEETAEQVATWFERRRGEAMPFDLAATLYERDRDTFASVLGAALAMRLFLFLVPFMAVVVGVLIVVFGPDGIDSVLQGASVTGSMANQIRSATDTTRPAGLALLASGLVLSLWAGRSLTRGLAACSAGAWRITGREGRATLRMAGTVTSLIALLLAMAGFMNRVREQFPLPLATTSWLAMLAVASLAWFAVTWSLPRRTSDPGALLPGAVLTGVTLTALQWVMQYYLPGRIERASDLTGSLGLTIATLGYLFMVGRIMAASLILNAVVWERLGSITGVVFALPLIRRLPARSPALARFFDLGTPAGASAAAAPPPPGPEDRPAG